MEPKRYIPITVTLKPHCPLFPLPSTALHSTFVCPMIKLDPDGGMHDTVTASPLLSVALGVSHFTTAVGCPRLVSTVSLVGQCVISGFSMSARESRLLESVLIYSHNNVSQLGTFYQSIMKKRKFKKKS